MIRIILRKINKKVCSLNLSGNTKPMQKRPSFSPPFLVSGVPTAPVRENGLSPVSI